jgi:hypothetical protein
MNDSDVMKFDNYWRTITRNEEFIRQHGHRGCPDWEDKWHQDLEDAYLAVRPLLAEVTEQRMFYDLPCNLNPLEAENYHHALVIILNPPEFWFGNLGVLRSPEYLALKREAENEERSVTRTSLVTPPVCTSPDLLEGLNDTAWEILHAIDRVEPRRWKEIGRLAGYSEDKVRQYSTELQEKQFIKKTPRGFVRLVTLPDECESQ